MIDKHWMPEDRMWYINPKEYDLQAAPVKLYVPTLEKDAAILEWAIARTREKKQLNEVFLRFLPWMLPKAPKDPQVLDKFIKDCESQFKGWDIDMFNFNCYFLCCWIYFIISFSFHRFSSTISYLHSFYF